MVRLAWKLNVALVAACIALLAACQPDEVTGDIDPLSPAQELELLQKAHVVVHPGYFFDFRRGAHLVVSLLPEPGVFAEAMKKVFDQVAAS